MKKGNVIAWIGAHLAASIVFGGTALGQFVAGTPPVIVNNNPGGGVGINTGPMGVAWACDPLEISWMGGQPPMPPPALRLSTSPPTPPPPPGGICGPTYAQFGLEVFGGAFSSISVANDVILANQGLQGGDVIIGARTTLNTVPVGAIRFTTQNPDIQRMSIQNNGNVSIGLLHTATPVNKLDIAGNAVIGSGYAGTSIAPANGLLVQGRVGIGKTAPSEALDVLGNVRFSGALMPNNSAGTPGTVLQSNGPGVAPTWVSAPAPAGAWSFGGNAVVAPTTLGTTTNHDLPIITNNQTRVTITAGGNVGIGTTTPAPAAALDVVGNVQFSGTLRPGGAPGSILELLQSNGPTLPPTWVNANTVVTATAVTAHAWGLVGNAGTTAGTNYIGTSDAIDLVVKTDAVERLRIAGSSGGGVTAGNVGIGIAPDANLLNVGGDTRIGGDLVVTGTLTVLSDARLKQNVATLDNALGKVLALRGVSYDFRPTSGINLPETHQIGFLAQEVERVIPEVVTTTSDGYRGVAYHNLVPVLVEGIKEQQTIIETQRSKIDDLSARLTRLESLLDPSYKPAAPETTNDAVGIQLEQNTPNPFDRSTTIRYMVPASVTSAEMVIFEAGTGREVERFILANRGKGEVTVNVAGFASGSYVYGIVADGRLTQTRTMVVAR